MSDTSLKQVEDEECVLLHPSPYLVLHLLVEEIQERLPYNEPSKRLGLYHDIQLVGSDRNVLGEQEFVLVLCVL